MQIRAAVLERFGEPLEVQELELAEPRDGRGARSPGGLRRLPYRPLHGLGRRPLRLCAGGARARGRRRRRSGRRGRARPGGRRPRGHALLAAVPRVRPLPRPAHEPLPGDPRAAGPRLPARRDDAALARRGTGAPLHGLLDVRRVHGHARDRAGEGVAGGAAGSRVPVRLRALDRARRGDEHGSRGAPARRASSSEPGWSGSAPSRAAGCRAPSGSSASISRRSGWSWRAARARPTRGSAGPTRSSRCWS